MCVYIINAVAFHFAFRIRVCLCVTNALGWIPFVVVVDNKEMCKCQHDEHVD